MNIHPSLDSTATGGNKAQVSELIETCTGTGHFKQDILQLHDLIKHDNDNTKFNAIKLGVHS
jgi:hypothetical protein